MSTPILLLEDEFIDRMWPLAVMNAAFDVTCGGTNLWQHLDRLPFPFARRGCVRDYLQAAVDAEFPSEWSDVQSPPSDWILVNARSLPTDALIALLVQLEREGKPTACIAGDELVAAYLAAETPVPEGGRVPGLRAWAQNLAPERTIANSADDWLVRYAHDVVRCHVDLLPVQLRHRISKGGLQQIRDGVFVGSEVTWQEPIATDTTAGPIVVEDGAMVMPFVYLRGPIWIGAHARVHPHAAVKDATVLGHHVRVGGETSGSIIEPYSNKQHDGFLGNSYLGSWVNLGAGTTNSNLKNSYGSIRIRVGDESIDTGMQFLGCVLGSHAKTAIHTRIMTGKLIGTHSLVYGTVSENIPDFVNYVSTKEPMTSLDLATATKTQARVFARRGLQQQDYHRQLLRDLHQLTSPGRVGLHQGPPRL